jgi:2-keto-3-deoxy-L-fuconate dehydrogenase
LNKKYWGYHMRLAGKRAFITAAGQGIGRAIAAAFQKEGAEVTATDLNSGLFSDADFPSQFSLDVTDKAALQGAITEARPDILVNCAGFVHAGTIAQATDDEFDFAFRLNVKSQFHAMQAVLPGMVERGGGSIINIASVVSSIVAAPNRFVYGASKASVIGMTKSVALDYVTQGVRCNCICPGTIESPSLQDRLRAMGDYDEARRAFEARQPMGRIGLPEEIAALAVYLGSDESAFTTGQAHVIDGGWAVG